MEPDADDEDALLGDFNATDEDDGDFSADDDDDDDDDDGDGEVTMSAQDAEALRLAQAEEGITGADVALDSRLAGLVESWAEGCAWNELLASTSLAEGDVCRLVRRTIDVLRSFAVCAELPARVRDNAR